jgi:ADP-dependent NAD(P)H-hydrate dehydratase / NAD(P)H-hydrate epimerase
MRALEYGRMDSLAEKKTVLAIGPGISRQDETAEFVRTIVRKYSNAIVLDADGLNAFEGKSELLTGKGRSLVITPHPGEMARLSGLTVPDIQQDRVNVARSFAQQHHLVVVLKGHRTIVAFPDGNLWVNTTGNPGMATGGTGDILTGMVAGFMAQYPDRIAEAVIAAVHLHGLAGDVARESMGEQSLVATDLVRALPEAIRRSPEASTAAFVRI